MKRLSCDLGVAALVYSDNKILLVQEAQGTFKGKWGLPKGFVDPGELPRDAALRELKEECGLDGEVVRLLCVKGDPKRDPRGHVISIAYVVSADGEPTAGDDAACAGWYDISQVKQMAGDHLSILEEFKNL